MSSSEFAVKTRAPHGIPFVGWGCPFCGVTEVPDEETSCADCTELLTSIEFINCSRERRGGREAIPQSELATCAVVSPDQEIEERATISLFDSAKIGPPDTDVRVGGLMGVHRYNQAKNARSL